MEQLQSGSSTQGSVTMSQIIYSRPKQIAVRRLTPQNNHASNQNNATLVNKGLPTINDTTKANTQASKNLLRAETDQKLENKTDVQNTTDDRGLVNRLESHTLNTTSQDLPGTNVNVQQIEDINGLDQETKNENKDQTDRKKVIESVTVQETNCVISENQFGPTENVTLTPGQEHSFINIVNSDNKIRPSDEASNQSEPVSKQELTGSEPSAEKENKKNSGNVIIGKKDLHFSNRDILGKV